MPKGRQRKTTSTHYRLATMEDMEAWWQEHEVDVDDNTPTLSKRAWKLIAGGAILALGLSAVMFPLATLSGGNRAIATTAPAAGLGDDRSSTVVDSYETINSNSTIHEQTFTYSIDANSYQSWKDRLRSYQDLAFRDEPDVVNLTVTSTKHSISLLHYTGTNEEKEQVRSVLTTFDRFGDIPEYKTVHFEIDLQKEADAEQHVIINIETNQNFISLDASLRRAFLAIPEASFDTHNYTVNLTLDTDTVQVPVTISAEVPDSATVMEHVSNLRTDETPVKNVSDKFGNPDGIRSITYRLPHKELPGMLTVEADETFSTSFIGQFNSFWDSLDGEKLPPLIGELRNADESLAYGNWLP